MFIVVNLDNKIPRYYIYTGKLFSFFYYTEFLEAAIK